MLPSSVVECQGAVRTRRDLTPVLADGAGASLSAASVLTILGSYLVDRRRGNSQSPRRTQDARRGLRIERLEDRLALSIVAGGTGDGNTTPPQDDPGFANVGIRGSGSAVYLGDGWVLTATHVGAGATLFNNTWYNPVANSAVQLANPPGNGYSATTDLTLYQIDGRPNLPSVLIGSAPPAVGWQVTMIGNGRDRLPSQAFWTSSWAPAASPAPYAGYIWAATQNIRWGTNVVSTVGIPSGVGANSETAFATQFTGNTQYDAQGTPGDSGGGVFHKDAAGNWNLAGLMFSTSSLSGQPWGISVYGNSTYSADLSVYRSQIYHTLALPGDPNFDGIVNNQDLGLIASHWMETGNIQGDTNGDHIVNAQDIAIVASNWFQTSGGGAGSGAALPEPSTLILAALGGLALLARRRWRA